MDVSQVNSKQMKQIIRVQFVLAILVMIIIWVTLMVSTVAASTGSTQEVTQSDNLSGLGIGAGLAIGLAGLGAGVGLGTASSAAIGAISERPEMFGRTIIFVAFIEGIGVFGFVIAFLLYLAIGG
ncbi:MAG: V-type ATP synthase subunit K [Candidatus Heimdallarchaeota archaeon]|nr:V-type ATP synthase subunit K [Candidatus Heimdallarchaeota archaeon]